MGLSNLGANLIGQGVNVASGLAKSLGGGRTNAGTAIGDAVSQIGTVVPPPWGWAVQGAGVLTSFISSNIGAKMNNENIAEEQNAISDIANDRVTATNTNDIIAQASKFHSNTINKEDIGEAGWFGSGQDEIDAKYDELVRKQQNAESVRSNNLDAALKTADIMRSRTEKILSMGGNLHTNGAIWDIGLKEINNGGTHEENPYEGVQMGIDQQGIPNLVEEGEVIFNNYVFSKRLKANGGLLDMVNLPKKYNAKSFADIAKALSKDIEERPNDPISKRGFIDSMTKLQSAQEYYKAKKEQAKNRAIYKNGGRLANKFVEGGMPDDDEATDPTNNGHIFTMDQLDAMENGGGKTRGVNWKGVGNMAMRTAPLAFNFTQGLINSLSDPDYSRAEALEKEAINVGNYTPVVANTINSRMTYSPVDTTNSLRELGIEARNTMSNITANSLGNSNAALAGIMATSNNYQKNVGNVGIQAELANFDRQAQVEKFNAGIEQYNAEARSKVDKANQENELKAKQARSLLMDKALAERNTIDANRSKAISDSFANLATGIGDLGKELISAKMAKSPSGYGVNTTTGDVEYNPRAFGGYLTIKNNKRKKR